jgi:hypothetical protein
MLEAKYGLLEENEMVTWSDEAKAYPLVDICKATGMPDFVLPMAVKGYKTCAEESASKKSDQVVEVKDLRECIAKGFQERYPDEYETIEDAYKRLEELEKEVGYTPPSG